MENNITSPLERLTESQKRAVLHKEGPLLVLAGPGSGKTRVITCRIASLIQSGVRPYHICAITFTNKASQEMRRRVEQMCPAGTFVSTFHSLCVWILRRYAQQAGIGAAFTIYDEGDQQRCMKEAIRICNVDSTTFSPSKMLGFVSRLKNNLESAESLSSGSSDYFTQNAAKVYKVYQELLLKNNALDFDDLLVKTAYLLSDHCDVRRELSNRFRYLLIDEYQDTNHAQYKIAHLLASEHGNICVTGDPDQSIYKWRGANIGNILAFEKDWPQAVVVKLEENFRSTPNILRMADKVIAFNSRRKPKSLIPTRPDGMDVAIQSADDEANEAALICQEIEKLHRQGVKMSEVAVFYRINAMSRPIEEALIRKRIPYQVVRGVEFYSRKEVQDLLSYLKLIVNPSDDVAFVRAIGTHSRGVGKTSVEKLAAYASLQGCCLLDAALRAKQVPLISAATAAKITDFAQMIRKFQQQTAGETAPLMDCVFAESGLIDALKAENDQSAVDNVNSLINAASEYDQQAEEPSLLDYLHSIALYSDTDAYDARSDKVSLMTLHAAKGLEFDHVFIAGLEDGILPHERSSGSAEDMEEERRLFFVGITRARQCLCLTYARHRVIRGQFLRCMPSQFLYEAGYAAPQEPLGGYHARDAWQWDADSDDRQTEAMPVMSAKGAGDSQSFRVHEQVEHASFGRGRVKEYLDLGPDSIVVVQFASGKSKSLMVKYAKLRRVGT